MQWTRENSRPITTETRLAFTCGTLRGYRNLRWNEFNNPETYGRVYTEDDAGVYAQDGSYTGEEPRIIILDESPTET